MDADAREMRLDPGATHCISYDCKDFVGKLVRTTGVIQGYHSGTKAKAKPLLLGTMRIKIEDDNETIYSFDVPDSILDPSGTTRIFCPQHWARACPTILEGSETTYGDRSVLRWKDKETKDECKKT